MKCKQPDKFPDEHTVLAAASTPKLLGLNSNSENKTALQHLKLTPPIISTDFPDTYCFDSPKATCRAISLVYFPSVRWVVL